MKTIKSVLPKAGMIFLIFTLLCGVIYTGVVTGIAQLIFSDNANGSIIEVDGKKYGCELLGQQYTDEAHMWGRIMNIDVSTYTDENGKALMYAAPSNLSPASEEYAQLVAERVEKLRAADPAATLRRPTRRRRARRARHRHGDLPGGAGQALRDRDTGGARRTPRPARQGPPRRAGRRAI